MGSRLEFRILGPLEVRLNGAPVRVGGPKQRALLALLLCNANRVVSRDQLTDELLRDQPAGSAEHVLHVQVSRLRKALADGAPQPRLLARPPGYLLRVEDGELDLHTFDRRVADGRQALERGDPGRAAVLLGEAESLWHGRPLADLEFEPFARFEVQRLEACRLAAMEDRIEAELALGRHGALCPQLEQLVAEHPLRERLRGQLMLALYRSGRQADALETYRAGRSLLAEELAVEPGPQLRQLQLAVLGQDTALDLPQPAAPHSTAPSPAGPARQAPAGSAPEAVPSTRRRRAKWAVLAVGAGAALAALAVPLLVSHATAHVLPAGNLLALVSPSDGTLQATVPLRSPPSAVAAGSGSVWAAEPSAGLVVRVDPARRAVAAAIPVGTHPSRITVAGGQVWVLDPAGRTVSRIDPRTDTVAQTIALGGQPSDVLASAGSLWVANRDGTVLRLDPVTGRVMSVVRTGGDPSGLAAAAGAVWVAADGSGTIVRIGARTGTVTGTVRVGDAPAAVAAGTAGLWVLDPLDATVSRLDPRRGAVAATVPLGGAPAAVAQSGGYVWVAEGQDGTLLRLDPRRGTVTRFRLGGRLSALAAAGGGMWAAAGAAGAGHRGGTLTSISSYAIIDTIDPAASTSPNVAPPQLFGLTNDGLVTLNHVAGPAGTRLVPDLALALPVPTGNGRTYTFRLRPGIRYSTGALVKPSDVAHSFQRLFQLGSSGTSYYQEIAGATACLKTPRSCDLSQGIVADDRAGTVTFHLTRPDPDFLYKLTLAYADVLPATVPGRQARAPLPATGPYMITRYLPGRELLLTRNPRFREWSAAAQPVGNPERIMIRLGVSAAQGATAVARGTGDFLPNLGQIPGDAGYFLHHRSQLRINPAMITGFMFLNVNAPPFDQLRVRQALNLALDRQRIVSSYGGPLAAQPACQILPPPLPGYRRLCPYTRDPDADGRWLEPDLARARQLVAASGTTGMKVTVWNTPPPPQATVAETRAAVTALRQLGYRASLRLLPATTYYNYTNDSRNHAQVIDGGWGADYPSADAFISKLTCNYFTPGNGQATTDASEFCDPALDRQVARAAALQPTDPPAATALWAQLDRQLTGFAIWLPTVTPNETDLISRRTGNYQYNPVWGALIDQLWVRLLRWLALFTCWAAGVPQYAAGGCRMQNSFPSGSARMCQRQPPSVTGVLVSCTAPSARTRLTSAPRSAVRRSRCSRFFPFWQNACRSRCGRGPGETGAVPYDPTIYLGSAPHYRYGRPAYSPELEAFLTQKMGLDGNGRLLDVGCGPGVLTVRLAHLFAEAVGLDPDAGMLAEGRRAAEERQVTNIRWVQALAEDLPAVAPGPYRLVTFGQSFHWTDEQHVAETVYDMLEPGGSLALIVHTVTGRPRPPDPGVPAIPHDEIKALVEKYLGSTRRAGQGTSRLRTHRFEDVLALTRFGVPQQFFVPGIPDLLRDSESVLSGYFSLSSAAPHLFGDRLDDFAAEVRALLAERSPEGIFWDWPGDTEVVTARKPG